MKLLTRALIILAAGALVAGALLAFGRTGLATQMREAGPRGGHFEGRGGPPPGLGQGGFEGRPEGRPEGGFEGRGGGHNAPSLGGLPQALGSLVKVGVIVALVALAGRLLGLGRRQDRPARASTGETTRL